MGNHFSGVAGDPNNGCPYCKLGLRFGWIGQGVFHTHDETTPKIFKDEMTPKIFKQDAEKKNIVINPLTFLGNDIQVDGQDIAAANNSVHKFFQHSGIDPMTELQFDLVVALAKLCKYRIRVPIKIPKETEMMLSHAKHGNFNEVLEILEKYPGIVNYIPAHKAWGVIHQLHISIIAKLSKPSCKTLNVTHF